MTDSPLAEQEPGPPAPMAVPTAALELVAPILIVDDDDGQRLAFKSMLVGLGHPIVEAASGVAGLRCVMAQDFAVIVLDVRMPNMDGFETAALIRKRHQSELTPIIFITAHSRDEISDASVYAAGAVGFMCAPVDASELRARVSVFANQFIKATELAAAAAIVQASADQLQLLTDAAPIGIFRTDAQNRYAYTNPRWTEITGVSAEDVMGTELGSRLSFGMADGTSVELVEADVGDDETTLRVEIKVPGAPTRTVVATSKLIPTAGGGFAGRVGTLADVTAETEAEATLSDARDKADEASRLKSDFLANMSHEIRTPMNGVLGMTDLLLESSLDPVQRDYAETVRSSGEALLTIINDILDFSKIEAGMLEVERVDFPLRVVVDDVVKLMRPAAEAKGLDLAAVVDETVPVLVKGDPGRVRQVLTNLIGNSIKFTKAGGVLVRVASAASSEAGQLLRFEIEDTGVGIAADKLLTIFEPFTQADSSTSRKYGGTGLGLAISTELVELMGGDCGVSSEPDVGSTFWFTVLMQEATPQVAGQLRLTRDVVGDRRSTADPFWEPSTGRLLLAEDNLVNQKVAVAMLTGAGYVVDVVSNGSEAILAAQQQTYDLILMDCQMPTMNGFAATERIRCDQGAVRRTPIVALTAGARREDERECLAAGMDAYLSKPITKDALLTMVARWTPVGARAASPADEHVPS